MCKFCEEGWFMSSPLRWKNEWCRGGGEAALEVEESLATLRFSNR